MHHFATDSGKSKGQFYTPAEVSRLMAKVGGVGGVKRMGFQMLNNDGESATMKPVEIDGFGNRIGLKL